MTARHTPGPWSVQRAADGINLWVGCPRYTVATVSTVADNVNLGEMDANARLIAAAPDLLEALREFVQTMDALPKSDETSGRVWDTYHTARAAIAKVTGEAA